MRFGRRKQATAVAVAVIGGLLSPFAPTATAAPADPGKPPATSPDRADSAQPPAVWPRPQSIRAAGPA
ncbi:hypothetical protein G3I39_34215, partial [Streptomyces fulvissimus]